MKRTIVKIGLLSAIALLGMNQRSVAATSMKVETVHGEHKEESFKVYGNCGMCERTIEGALKEVKGVEKADWNKESKMMEVAFDPELISLEEIKQKIAAVGYDTEEFRATEKAYKSLPGCCQYERPEAKE
jgi:copper chaperone CopZ